MEKITLNEIKYINKLNNKDFRKEEQLFILEGVKIVEACLKSDFEIVCLYATPDWIEQNTPQINTKVLSNKELERISNLSTPNKVLALVKQKPNNLNFEQLHSENILILDTINDPGNLGTIVRLANWYGIKTIICSNTSVDIYNYKTLQASKGGVLGVNVYYENLETILPKIKLPIIAADIVGSPLNNFIFPEFVAILMGSESHGISNSLKPFITNTLTIPCFNTNTLFVDSLNVAMATSILLAKKFN